ncbi:response regulator [candidate division TA06 bacterium]|nr:response regulator [candidate division TA06 bacterium]
MNGKNNHKVKIMVIDDEEDILDMVKLILEEAGYAVLPMLSGHEALQLIYRERPSLILLDIMMPDLDGLELLKILKIEETTAGIPVVMLTAKVEARDKMAALRDKAADYICKPFQPQDLVDRVKAVLGKGK